MCTAHFTDSSSRNIAIRADGYKEIGFGHIYRAMILVDALNERGHKVSIACLDEHTAARCLLESMGYPPIAFPHDDAFCDWIAENEIDIVVNDVLDTEAGQIAKLKKLASRVVAVEDRSADAACADAIINAIYEHPCVGSENEYFGSAYMCLRPEVIQTSPALFREEAQRVLVTFGGTDPLDLSNRIIGIVNQIVDTMPTVRFTLVLGPGYKGAVSVSDSSEHIKVLSSVSNIHEIMANSDIAICSGGTTVYELACMGVPSIVIAQNERETSHTFASWKRGFTALGYGADITDEEISFQVRNLLCDNIMRRKMRERQLACDLSGGIGRVCDIVLGAKA